MVILAKLEELEQASNLHNANVVALVSRQNQRIDSLEAECSRLHILVADSHMEALSLASNNLDYVMHARREDATLNQAMDPMDIDEQSFPQVEEGE